MLNNLLLNNDRGDAELAAIWKLMDSLPASDLWQHINQLLPLILSAQSKSLKVKHQHISAMRIWLKFYRHTLPLEWITATIEHWTRLSAKIPIQELAVDPLKLFCVPVDVLSHAHSMRILLFIFNFFVSVARFEYGVQGLSALAASQPPADPTQDMIAKQLLQKTLA